MDPRRKWKLKSLGRKAEALGFYLQPDGKTYRWTPAPPAATLTSAPDAPAAAPITSADGEDGE